MAKTYDVADQYVEEMVESLIRRHHPHLAAVGVTIDLLWAMSDNPDSPAVALHGVRCYAVVKKISLDNRILGQKDARITIDKEAFELMLEDTQQALLDHELEHLKIKLDKDGRPKIDDSGRPMLEMKKHDFDVGWFKVIADRWGAASIERRQAKALWDDFGQSFMPFLTESLTFATTGKTLDQALGLSPTRAMDNFMEAIGRTGDDTEVSIQVGNGKPVVIKPKKATKPKAVAKKTARRKAS